MEKTVLISLPIEDLQTVIIDCVNACLKQNRQAQNNHHSEAPEQLMTVHEAANFLGLKLTTVRTNASKGLLPVMKQGNRLYFSRVELMAYVKAGRKLTVAETAAQADAYLQGKKKGGSHA